jgi:hypothetical protein
VLLSHAAGALALSLPWPLLLVLVDEHSNDPVLLGLAGSARMLPFVLCSWLAGRLADACRRDLIVRATLVARGILMLVGALALLSDHVWLAVTSATLAVAVATPAYPALVAAMPGVAGPQRRAATDLLVTIEVAAFVVGAALGGLLLQPATRDLLPWVPVLMTAVALVLILPVSMPAPTHVQGEAAHLSAYRSLRHAPAAWRAMTVMAAVNLSISVVALALLPMAEHVWSSDATGYGLATGVLGLAALGAPLLRVLGIAPEQAMRRVLLVLSAGVALVIAAPTVGWALAPLALAGAAAVRVEAAATGVLQEQVSDRVRATVLGLNDTVIITAALIGTLIAPVAIELAGSAAVLGSLAGGTALVAWWARPGEPSRAQSPATVGATSLEAHEPARPSITPEVDRVARRAALRRERLLALERQQGVGVVVPRRAERSPAPAEVRRAR